MNYYHLKEKTEIPELHSILLVSNAFGYGRFPKPWEEIEQHLSISETGEVRVNGYGWSFGEDELEMFDSPELQEWLKTHTLTKPNANGYRRLRSERIRISPADARFLLSVIGLMIRPVLIVDEVTDVGTWELTATDINGKKHKYFGPLYGCDTRAMESRYGIRVSDLFRRVLEMDDLFMFDGNSRRTIIKSADEVIIATVVFGDGEKEYNYLTDIANLVEGDLVYVPVGADNRVEKASVTYVAAMLPENASYPVNKMKKIIGMADV